MTSIIIYLALGSNLGNRLENMRAAVAGLPPDVTVLKKSPIYETQPWGVTEQPAFLNMVVKAHTSLAPLPLLKYLKRLEVRLGRLPSIRYGPRKIDLDILFYDDMFMQEPGLTIPHPHLQERPFVLVPLADLAPELVHPISGLTIREILAKKDDTGVVRYKSGL